MNRSKLDAFLYEADRLIEEECFPEETYWKQVAFFGHNPEPGKASSKWQYGMEWLNVFSIEGRENHFVRPMAEFLDLDGIEQENEEGFVFWETEFYSETRCWACVIKFSKQNTIDLCNTCYTEITGNEVPRERKVLSKEEYYEEISHRQHAY